MKKLFFITMLLVGFSSLMLAQNMSLDPNVVAQNQTDKMKMDLNLRPEQIDSVHAINLKYAKLMNDLETSGLQPQSLDGQRQKLRYARMNELKPILDEEQFVTYRKITQEEMQGNKQNGKGKAKGKGKVKKEKKQKKEKVEEKEEVENEEKTKTENKGGKGKK